MKSTLIFISVLAVSSLYGANSKIGPPNEKPGGATPESGALVVKDGGSYFPGGCGFRKALGGLVKVYEICFFGKNMKASEWANAFEQSGAKKSFKLKLTFLRAVGGKKVSSAFSEGLSKTPSENKLEELDRQKFIAWASNLKIEKDSVMELTFNDGHPMTVVFFENPKNPISIQDLHSDQKGMARAVAGIWLGAKPLNDDLKANLLADPNATAK